jgi:hypothetical protein
MFHSTTAEPSGHVSKEPLDYKQPFLENPIFPDTFLVCGENSGTIALHSKKNFRAGETIVNLELIAKPSEKSWHTVQFSETEHFYLNCEVIYLNHCCEPNTRWDTCEKKLIAVRDIKQGDELTYFYPSTEWEMANSFRCWCRSMNCMEEIRGASQLAAALAEKYTFAPHIINLFAIRDQKYEIPFQGQPKYPSVVRIVYGADFSSKAVAAQSFIKGQVLCDITGYTDAKKRWSSVQIAENKHIELNSELVFLVLENLT